MDNEQDNAAPLIGTYAVKSVIIPASAEHGGYDSMLVRLIWACPVCGGPRGDPYDGASFDGSRKLMVHQWDNPCGHVDKYSDVRREAANNPAPRPPAEAVTVSPPMKLTRG